MSFPTESETINGFVILNVAESKTSEESIGVRRETGVNI